MVEIDVDRYFLFDFCEIVGRIIWVVFVYVCVSEWWNIGNYVIKRFVRYGVKCNRYFSVGCDLFIMMFVKVSCDVSLIVKRNKWDNRLFCDDVIIGVGVNVVDLFFI